MIQYKDEGLKAKLIRIEQTEQGALGPLVLDGEYFCSFLMPDAGDPERYQIPAGLYPCRRYHGKRWVDTFEIVVGGHTALLFHSGNTEANSLGCTLLGQYPGKLKGQRAILNSGQTFNKFMVRLEGINEFQIEIVDLY